MLRRWWLRRRHGAGEWGFLLQPPPAGEWVSLDLETTGLDPAKDHILSLAAVPIRGGRLLLSERFERQIRPDRAFGIESIRHHRITPEEAASGISVTPAVREFLHWLGSRRLLGYHLAFDLAMLAPHVQGLTGFALPNARADLAEAMAAREHLLHPEVPPNLEFEHIAAQLGVTVLGRHTALGDAVTTGLCWLALHARGEKPR
ncbi:exonuclease domain-containing protein [Pseudoxanthomonas wuyuanensis]|uniref:DNA polymerase-3 subunit epsilon n=1 Tax=Pseudoxanthomonas wuyuanensis TaxID=1073196 RepID=A0A286D8E3_9GAMM|nr:exonuclease domain-containing protein [Pseudoxanthomonas wuyuanensis]KAF1716125.1 DNA polymerase III subunit epsilon [Pseudoxanthomonas wuyuanensis]SOD54928.1 DNA polymerase-3 subunit epsilon [Pseudoxanthomonas wuyuanensis]